MKISDIFYINQGHQITDEELYNNIGIFPVYTGSNEIKGFWHNRIIEPRDLPCISYPTKANLGVVFIQKELFDANNTAVLIPKAEWRNKLHLEWFKYKLPSIFLKLMTSRAGVSYLNKEIVEEIDINLPSMDDQILEAKYYKNLDDIKQGLIKIKNQLDLLKHKNIMINTNEIEETLISNIFSYISRNDSLTEEGVYNFTQNKEGEIITVLSGSTQNILYGTIIANTSLVHCLKNKQCIHLVTRGKAGKLTYLDKGTYATNTNANLIFIKKENWEKVGVNNEQQEKIYLKFMEIYLQPLFYQEVSNSDVGVFAVSQVIKKLLIPLFKYSDEMITIVGCYDIVNGLEKIINKKVENIDVLIGKEIIGTSC